MLNKKQKLRKVADKLWFQVCLKDKCEVCGNKNNLQVHHFFPKSCYGHIRYDLDNGISLCMGCHFKWHHKGDPVIGQTIQQVRGKKWLARLFKKAMDRPEGNYLTTKYYEDVIKGLNCRARRS